MTVIHQAYHDLFGRWERGELTDQQLIEATLFLALEKYYHEQREHCLDAERVPDAESL